MKYKSTEDLRNLSDKEVEDFLKKYWKASELTFYGIFEPNMENPKNFSGTMTRLKVPGSKVCLTYPLSDRQPVEFKIPSNQRLDGRFYKFSCRLIPSAANRCQMQILLNTLEKISERDYNSPAVRRTAPAKRLMPPRRQDLLTYKKKEASGRKPHAEKPVEMSPLAYRYSILEDEETGWGKDITQLMGIYRKQQDGTFCLEDIRKADFTRLEKYPKTTFNVSPLHLDKPIEGMEEGQYCAFNWKFSFKNKVNPCEIEVDEKKPIVFISPKDFVSGAQKATEKAEATLPKPSARRERQTDVCVLLYDLLREANRYNGEPVDVQFYITDKYLSFQHTGRKLDAETILDICGLGFTPPEIPSGSSIAYRCKGLGEFLSSNDGVIIISNGFSLRFDYSGSQPRPVWVEKAELPRDIKISLSRNKRFTESIILPFDDNDKSMQNNYKVGLQCVFEDEQNIAFFANIGKVTVKVKGGKAKTLDRRNWVVSREYMTIIPKTAKPEDISKRHTGAIFACLSKGNELIGEDDAPAFCLMPTASSPGFPFLMQLDVHVNHTNYTINHRDPWNKVYAGAAGRLFAKWIKDLTQQGKYTPESIYAIVPKFDECMEAHPEERQFISLFRDGFKDVIMAEGEKNELERKNPEKKELAKKNSGKKVGGRTFVIDTNIFVNCPNILSKMRRGDNVILSAKVVDELDNLKYKLEDNDLRNVQKALKNINVAIDKGRVSMEMSDVSLLPRDYNRRNPDNNILSVVLRHKAESPTLITSDNGLQIKAKATGINVIGLKDFLAKH